MAARVKKYMKRTNTVKEVRFKLDPVVSSGKIAIATLSLLIVATTVSCIGLGVILFQSINRYNDAYSSSVAALDSASNNYTNNSSQPVYITQVEYENSSIPNFDRFVNLPGANAYFLHTVRSVDQDDIIESMRLANIKLVRIFIRTLGGNSEGSGSNSLEDYEVGQIGNFDESKLAPIDELMYKTYKAGMKLVIALHDRWELGHCGE